MCVGKMPYLSGDQSIRRLKKGRRMQSQGKHYGQAGNNTSTSPKPLSNSVRVLEADVSSEWASTQTTGDVGVMKKV